MKAKQIYRLAKKLWFPDLQPRGFLEKNGGYLRILNSGVVHHIALDKDPHGADTFRLMCGVDSVPLREGTGLNYGFAKYDGLHHLTPKGWDYNSGRWPCETEDDVRTSLTALLPLILELAIPYFDPITTLSDVGNEINEIRMPHLGWMKARLYLLDGDIARARETLKTYDTYVASNRPWFSKQHVQEEIERAQKVRLEIETAEGGVRG